MDYVESFLINDGDMYSYDNQNGGNPKEIINGGKFTIDCYEYRFSAKCIRVLNSNIYLDT